MNDLLINIGLGIKFLRSPYIKQADVLQGFYFFEDDFCKSELRK